MADTTPALAAHTGGLLLAGGRSRRFGAEKAVARFGERTMMDNVLERFASLARTAVNARPESAAAAHAADLGLELVSDADGAPQGPLAGVAAGLRWVEREGLTFLATAPCDAPLLPRDLFAALLGAIGDAPAAVAVTAQQDYPLCALWRADLGAALERELASGAHPPVRALLARLTARRVEFLDERAFANANTRASLDALERNS